MKIAFNLLGCGLGNNGGSRTILLSAKTLRELGHDVEVVSVKDNFVWFKHPACVREPSSDRDLIVATAYSTVDDTLRRKSKKKAWYIRAHETWAISEKEIIKLYKKPQINIVNSYGLQRKLAEFGVDSNVVHQGIDFDLWRDDNTRPKDKIRIGCLHTKQPRKRWRDFVKLSEILGTKDYEYVAVGNSAPSEDFISGAAINLDSSLLRSVYSSCHIWFAPTESEGLHNVPMEAALCGCLVICSDAPLNGMMYDYAFDDTAMIYKSGDIEHAADLIRNPDWSLIKPMQKCVKEKIGDRASNMKKFLGYING